MVLRSSKSSPLASATPQSRFVILLNHLKKGEKKKRHIRGTTKDKAIHQPRGFNRHWGPLHVSLLPELPSTVQLPPLTHHLATPRSGLVAFWPDGWNLNDSHSLRTPATRLVLAQKYVLDFGWICNWSSNYSPHIWPTEVESVRWGCPS